MTKVGAKVGKMRKEVLVLAAAIVIAAFIIGSSLADKDDSRDTAKIAAAESTAEPSENETQSDQDHPVEEIPEEPTTVDVLDYGYSIDTSLGDRTANFAVIIENPSADYFIEQVELGVVFYDDSGTVVASHEGYASWIGPSAKVAVHGSLEIEGKAKTLRMDVEPSGITQFMEAPDPYGEFQVSGEKLGFDYGTPNATATIKSTYLEDIKDTLVMAVFYDSKDKIVGGAFTYEKIRGGAKTLVKVDGLYQANGVVRAEVYAAPSTLSNF